MRLCVIVITVRGKESQRGERLEQMFELKDVKYSEGWDKADFVGVAMTFTITETKPAKSPIEAYLSLTCEASDSRQPIRMCWCPECRDDRKQYGVRKQREPKASN